jgi:hypothetical protein
MNYGHGTHGCIIMSIFIWYTESILCKQYGVNLACKNYNCLVSLRHLAELDCACLPNLCGWHSSLKSYENIRANGLTSETIFFHSLAALDCSGRCNKTRPPLFWFWNNKWVSKLTGCCTPESFITGWMCFCPSLGSWHYRRCHGPNVRPRLSCFVHTKSRGERWWRFHGKLNSDSTVFSLKLRLFFLYWTNNHMHWM